MRIFVEKISFVKVDYSFFVLLILMIFLDEIRLFLLYIVFLLAHELMHLLVAKRLGYHTNRIRLSILGASLEGTDDFLLDDEIKIVLAGPLFNLCVAALCLISFWLNPESFEYFYDILLVNLAIFIFNFLPIFPLDMGRLILAFLSKKYLRIDACKKVKKISFCLVLFLFFVYLVSVFFSFNLRFGFVCVNLASLCLMSNSDTSFKRSIFAKGKLSKLKKGLIERKVVISNVCDYRLLFKYIDDYHFTSFEIYDKNLNLVDLLNELDLFKRFNLFE